MLKIYVVGCVSCHKTVDFIKKSGIEFILEKNQDVVMDVASRTIGIIPVFEYDNKFYNEKQISSMINSGIKFDAIPTIKEEVKIEETKIINKKTKEV